MKNSKIHLLLSKITNEIKPEDDVSIINLSHQVSVNLLGGVNGNCVNDNCQNFSCSSSTNATNTSCVNTVCSIGGMNNTGCTNAECIP
jgi:hypothetical protein